jgi:hypothetical protein
MINKNILKFLQFVHTRKRKKSRNVFSSYGRFKVLQRLSYDSTGTLGAYTLGISPVCPYRKVGGQVRKLSLFTARKSCRKSPGKRNEGENREK